MQSVPITTKIVSYNTACGTVYSIPIYMIKFVNYLGQVGGFLRPRRIFSTNKTDLFYINEI
jgi:hypothetical protein